MARRFDNIGKNENKVEVPEVLQARIAHTVNSSNCAADKCAREAIASGLSFED